MFGETTIFYIKIWNHPIETSIYKWLFGVPGCPSNNTLHMFRHRSDRWDQRLLWKGQWPRSVVSISMCWTHWTHWLARRRTIVPKRPKRPGNSNSKHLVVKGWHVNSIYIYSMYLWLNINLSACHPVTHPVIKLDFQATHQAATATAPLGRDPIPTEPQRASAASATKVRTIEIT